jgi:hypothetical protein
LATNDAAQLSLSEFAVLAIAPDLAPNEVVDSREGDEATVVNFDKNPIVPKDSDLTEKVSSGKWKKLFCIF